MKNDTTTTGEIQWLMFRDYPDVVDVDTMRKMLGDIGRKLAYRLLSEGKIESLKIGRAYKIPKINIISYLRSQQKNI